MQSNNSPPSSLPIAGTYREPRKPKPTPEVPLFIDVDHFAEAQKKEEERLAVNKRKLEEMVRDIHRRANAKLNAGKPPQVETKAEERQPETYYSDALGCEFTFPLGKFLSTYKQPHISAFRNSYYPRHPYCRFNEEKKEPPVKKFKFDPPTFKFGDDEKEESKKEEEEDTATANKKKEEEENYYDDAYDIPSHVPGVKLNKREIEMLVESSKRWKEKFNQLDSKPSSLSSIKKSTPNDLLSPSATPTLASSDESTSQD